jgi:hypothetical protein
VGDALRLGRNKRLIADEQHAIQPIAGVSPRETNSNCIAKGSRLYRSKACTGGWRLATVGYVTSLFRRSRTCRSIPSISNEGTVANLTNWYETAADIVDQMLLSSFQISPVPRRGQNVGMVRTLRKSSVVNAHTMPGPILSTNTGGKEATHAVEVAWLSLSV